MAMFAPDPIGALMRLQRALDASRSADWFGPSTSSVGAYPQINVFQQGDDLIVITELPGCEKNDLELQVKGNQVRIAGKKEIQPPEGASVHRRERVQGVFDRTIALPYELNADQVQANYQNGILALRLPRAEKDRPRSIDIR